MIRIWHMAKEIAVDVGTIAFFVAILSMILGWILSAIDRRRPKN